MGHFAQVNNISGFVFQNFIFNLLKTKYESPISPINYWRTKDKAEVDFVIHHKGEAIPVEVKYSKLKNTNISRSFRSYLGKYSPDRAMIVNLELDTTIEVDGTQIQFLPYWKLIC